MNRNSNIRMGSERGRPIGNVAIDFKIECGLPDRLGLGSRQTITNFMEMQRISLLLLLVVLVVVVVIVPSI